MAISAKVQSFSVPQKKRLSKYACAVASKLSFTRGGYVLLVLGINRILKWLQITTGERTYTCHTKMIDNVLHFRFKNQWYKVAKYVGEHTTKLIEEGGKLISKKFVKLTLIKYIP